MDVILVCFIERIVSDAPPMERTTGNARRRSETFKRNNFWAATALTIEHLCDTACDTNCNYRYP